MKANSRETMTVKPNIIKPNKLITYIYELIKEESALNFLKTTVLICEKLFYDEKFEQSIRAKLPVNTDSINGLLMENGFAHLNSKEMNTIFHNIQGILNVTEDTSVEENTFKYPLKNVLRTVTRNLNAGRNNERLEILKLFMNSNAHDDSLSLILFIQQLVVKEYTKKDRHKSGFVLKYTKFTILLGSFLLELALSKYDIFKNLTKFFKGKELMLSRKEQKRFVEYINNLLINNEKEIKNYYVSIGLKTNMISNTEFCALLKNYVLGNLFKKYEQQRIPVQGLHKIFESYASYDFDDNLYNVNTALVKIISPLISECSSEDLKPAPLFKLNVIQTAMKKSQKMISIHPMALEEFISKKAGNKPFIDNSNIKYLKDIELTGINKVILESISENKSKVIHDHLDLNLQYSENSYLKNTDLFTKYHIDINYYTYCLRLIVNIKQNKCSLEEKKDFITALYNIEQALVSSNADEEIFINTLLEFALEFDLNNVTYLEQTLEGLISSSFRKYNSIFNKIKNQRLIFSGILTDCLLYIHFKFFIMDSYLDSRGRFYCNLDFLNPRNYHLAKAFVKPYIEGQITSQNYYKIKEAVLAQIENSEIRVAVSNIEYFEYKNQIKNIIYENISDYFNTDIRQITEIWYPIKNKVLIDICSPAYISLLRKYLKKIDRLPYIHSVLISLCLTDSYEAVKAYIEYDASTSGIQMCAILLNSESLGKQSNLLGTAKSDIYSKVTQECSNEIQSIVNFISEIINSSGNNIYWPSIKNSTHTTKDKVLIIHREEFKELILSNNLVNGFLYADIDKSTYFVEIADALSAKMTNGIAEEKLKELVSKSHSFSWLLSKKDLKVVDKEGHRFKGVSADKNKEFLFMLITRACFKFVLSLQRTQILFDKNFFKDRTLFKNSIMTYFYNSRSLSRNDKMKEYLSQKISNEYHNDIMPIAIVFDKFFIKYLAENLPDNAKIFRLANLLAKQGKRIIIKTPNVNIKYYPKQQEKTVVETPTYKKQRGSQLVIRKISNKFDPDEFKNAFIPNFMHCMDAYIAQSFTKRFINANKLLKKHSVNVQLHYHTNHDTFGSINCSPFLKYIIEDSYLDLIQNRPITWIYNSLEKTTEKEVEALLDHTDIYKKLTRLNPNFVK